VTEPVTDALDPTLSGVGETVDETLSPLLGQP
jgi:hypothetical protein